MEQEELDKRDARILDTIREELICKRELAAQLRAEADAVDHEARQITSNVRAERWYRLEGLLELEDIESLCENSPWDLLQEKR